jgi:hypothetical protein
MASTIGIKVANGEFYPIMEENSSVKKRLILTTVHDNQKSVQIDLYNSFAKTMADALYIGSLVVEDIEPLPKGEPSIEMTLTSNPKGEISAEAVYLGSTADGVHHHLSVSLTSMEEESLDGTISDFDLESQDHPPRGLYEKASALQEGSKKGSFPWILAAIAGMLILVLGFLGYFFFVNATGVAIRTGASRRSEGTAAVIPPTPPAAPAQALPVPKPVPAAPPVVPSAPATPAVPAQAVPVSPAAPSTSGVPPVPVISAGSASAGAAGPAAAQQPADSGVSVPSRRTRPNPPVASYKVPKTIPKGGVPYKVRWGDTLWDISEAFYRNPWLYPRIARFNNIRNPDRIISGNTIRIPPRN